jgi:hypothetical protein
MRRLPRVHERPTRRKHLGYGGRVLPEPPLAWRD